MSNNKAYKFFQLDMTHGLSQNTINCIHQDQQGFFWFGTNGGLNKWNGYDFTVYTNSINDSSSIGQGRINCLHEEKNGDLWVGTFQGGLSKYNRSTNDFTNYFNFSVQNEHDQSNNILHINKYSGHIIIGTFGNGIHLLDTATRTFHPIEIYNNENEPLKNLLIRKILVDKDSNLWIGHDKGVIKITAQDLSLEYPILKGSEVVTDKNILSLFIDSHERLWIGTHYSGTFLYHIKDDTLEQIKLDKYGENFESPIIRDFIEDHHQQIWIGTGGNGITVLDKNLNFVQHYKSKLNNAYSISSDITYCLYQDNKNNIWNGTYNAGINYTNNYKEKFNHIRGFGGPKELNNNSVISLCEINTDNILVGTDGNGISIFNPNSGEFSTLDVFNNHDPSAKNIPISMAKDKEGNIIIGTFLKGLYYYNPKTGSLKNYRAGKNADDLLSEDIWSISVGKNNAIWIGTLGKGIAKFDPKTGTFKNYFSETHIPHSISDDFVFSIVEDHEGYLWIGTHNGGINVLIDEELGIFKQYKKDDGSGLSSNEVWKIYEDSKHNIWVTTHDGGVCIYNRKTNKFRVLSIEDGLLSNTNQSIIEDKNGNIWIGSNQGLSMITKTGENYSITNYDVHNGLQGNEFNFNAVISSSNNYLFMGGNNGFNYFHPDSLGVSIDVGPVVITGIQTLYHGEREGIRLSIVDDKNKEVKLDYNLSLISIDYALLDFTVPELNTYSYKLEGYDENWINAGSKRTVTYTNLDAGVYRFRVKGTNGLGIESEKEDSLTITLTPPFWERGWFRLISILILSGVILLLYFIKERAHKRQELLLLETVNKRTAELLDLNQLLAEKNTQVKQHSEEIITKSEHLTEANTKLENSYIQIEKQNSELGQHRNHLEELVKKRTLELEKSKIKAEESEKLKLSFLANMSHEIRTPMNAILGFSALIANHTINKKELDTYYDHIYTNGQALLRLIDDVLDLSKIDANQIKLAQTNFDIIKLVKDSYQRWLKISKAKYPNLQLKLNIEQPNEELYISGDTLRIKQIINQLIDNALKFTCEGEIIIIVEKSENVITVSIKDSGIGIKEEDMTKIFDRFRKSDDENDNRFRGAGLGLTISKRLANLMKGQLWAESEYGKGSTFYFSLPR